MEINLQTMNSKFGKSIYSPWQQKKMSGQKPKNLIMLCRAGDLCLQKVNKTNMYEVLSLTSENVGFDEIKRAYRRMALRYHPDVCPLSDKEESTRRFVELREAYEVLSDPILRRKHDYELGLATSTSPSTIGFGFEGFRVDKRMRRFSKDAWEMQLCGLKQRSHMRIGKQYKSCRN